MSPRLSPWATIARHSVTKQKPAGN
jgi:hypothetical protein